MKKLLCVLLALMAFGLTACGGGETPPQENTDLPRIFAPVVKVSKSGLASWTDLEGATEFAYKINNGEEVKTSEHSVQLNLNDVIIVKCLGDNVTRRDSRWSEEVQYVPPHSFVWDNSGQASNVINIYKEDGTVVLDTITGTKMFGDVLETGVKYIFEFDITVGAYHNALLLAGVENAVISDLIWSDSAYPDREGEKADAKDKLYEVAYNTSYNLYPDYPGLHRFDWAYSPEYWGMSTYGWNTLSTPAANENGVYDTTAEGFWTVEPNWCAALYGAHFLSSGKDTKTQTDAGYKYLRFAIEYEKFNTLSTGQVDGVEQYGELLGRERFNLFALLHQNMSYIFFDSDKTAEYEAREHSMTVDENGEAAAGVNVYDAESGELILGAMTDRTAQGGTLTTGKKYIFEFDVSGDQNGAVLFTGVEDAKISQVTWSDKTYAEKDGENAVTDTLRVVGMDTEHHHLKADEPLFHRIWKSSDGYTANYLRDCAAENGVIETAKNRDNTFNTCMTFARKHWYASKLTADEAGRQYFRMTVEFNELTVIDVGGVVTDENNPEYGTLAATYFNMFVYSPAGGRYLYLTPFYPA